MKQLRVLFIFVFVSLFTFVSYSGEFFTPKRFDTLVPEQCREMKLSHFPSTDKIETIIYGIQGALRKGFTHEVNLGRGEARRLWGIMKGNLHERSETEKYLSSHNRAAQAYNVLLGSLKFFDFSWNSEGEVLESLALSDLSQTLSDEYYVTGGVEYHETVGRTLGELDIIVARRSDCKVVALGEAKLGLKSLSKARKQLNRIRRFLSSKNH